MTSADPSRTPAAGDVVPAHAGGWRAWLGRYWLAVLVVAAVVSGATGVAVGLLLRSPADVAASAQPPTPTLMTAEVDERVLVDAFSMDVELVSEHAVSIGPAGQVQQGSDGDGKDEATSPRSVGTGGSTEAVITQLPAGVGDTVAAGALVLEVSGRPVIALTGDLPAYRDLAPGASGPDVTQLQQALAAQGLLPGSQVDGVYGAATSEAVSRLYSSLGYTAPSTDGGSGEDGKALREASAAVRRAREAVDAVQEEGASTAPDRASLTTARSTLLDAQADLADLKARTGVILPRSEVVFLPGGRATVMSVSGQVGQEAGQEIVSLGAGELVLRGEATTSQAAALSIGAAAAVDALGDGVACQVTALDTVESARTQVTIGCEAGLDPTALSGRLTARLTRAATATSVLCVPIGAVSERGDGTTTLITLTGTDTLTRIEVTVGLEADGYIEVRPKDPDALTAGSVVIVGGQ